MNQPKFNYGNEVMVKDSASRFNIFAIGYDAGTGYYYRDEYHNSHFYKESELELYKEPQKKKLYAYRLRGQTEFKFDLLNDDYLHPQWSRAPEYDIEYLEPK